MLQMEVLRDLDAAENKFKSQLSTNAPVALLNRRMSNPNKQFLFQTIFLLWISLTLILATPPKEKIIDYYVRTEFFSVEFIPLLT